MPQGTLMDLTQRGSMDEQWIIKCIWPRETGSKLNKRGAQPASRVDPRSKASNNAEGARLGQVSHSRSLNRSL